MEYKGGKRCVMDTTAPEIKVDNRGCNFCDQAEIALAEIRDNDLMDITKLKTKDKYDVLIGLSGGVDSSYMLMKAVEMGLRPLCFSVDNGWNDPRADENIMRLVEGMKVPFYRYNIKLDQFKSLQAAFIQAGVPNIEIPTDHILMATTFEVANRYGIKTILSGGNVATESIMPASWGYNARDLVHIKDIYHKMTGTKLKGLPVLSLLKWNYYRWVKKIKIVYLLDYLNYNRAEAIKELEKKFGYKEYGDKHQESEFTTWFQNFYLYEKFGFDKRKPHYSSMIMSGQMTRSDAMERLCEQIYYPKFGIEEQVMKYPKHKHEEYKMDNYNLIAKIVKCLS